MSTKKIYALVKGDGKQYVTSFPESRLVNVTRSMQKKGATLTLLPNYKPVEAAKGTGKPMMGSRIFSSDKVPKQTKSGKVAKSVKLKSSIPVPPKPVLTKEQKNARRRVKPENRKEMGRPLQSLAVIDLTNAIYYDSMTLAALATNGSRSKIKQQVEGKSASYHQKLYRFATKEEIALKKPIGVKPIPYVPTTKRPKLKGKPLNLEPTPIINMTTGEYFGSAASAGRAIKKGHSNIMKVLAGTQRSAYGSVYRPATSEEVKAKRMIAENNKGYSLATYSSFGNGPEQWQKAVINVTKGLFYNSVGAAADAANCKPLSVSCVLLGKAKTTGGQVFRYATEEEKKQKRMIN